MASTNDLMMNSSEDQYKDAFNEADGGAPQASGVDNFGIEPPAEAVAAAEAEEGSEPAAEEAMEGNPGAAESDQPSEQANNAVAAPADDKEEQRRRSYEGRLRKLEEQIAAKGATQEPAGVEALEDAGEQAEDSGNEDLGEAVEKAAEAIEDGSMSLKQAMEQLTADFGEPFVKMIEAIASAKAGEVGAQASKGVQDEVAEIISHISDSNERSHFEKISQACPNFMDVRQDPAFQAFVQGDAANTDIAANGSAADVIKMIKSFEAQAPATPAQADAGQPSEQDADPEGPSADADAAAGVRSGGLRIPDAPADSSDYEGAWDEASRK